MRNLEEKLEEEYLNGMALLHELKRVKQAVERNENENKLLRRTTEDALDGTVRGGSCSMKIVDRLVEEWEAQSVGPGVSAVQRFGSCCSREVSEFCNFSRTSVQEREGWCEESPRKYMLQKEDRILVPVPLMLMARSGRHYFHPSARGGCFGEDHAVRDRERELDRCGGRVEEEASG